MLFNSPEFLFIFLPITLMVFFGINSAGLGKRYAIAWLVISSIFFYGWWNPAFLVLIGFSISFNYAFGLLIHKHRNESKLRSRILTIVGVLVNIALIAYFKYANFFVATLNDLAGLDWHLGTIILPLAISFFTFQQITYLVDTHNGIRVEHDFMEYVLFVTFFPQLIAGPIVHHKDMFPQFARDTTYRFRFDNFAVGSTIFIFGLFKKVVVADNFGALATPVFEATELGYTLNFFKAGTGIVCYSFQLYFDFSGYSDMAIGLARLFGIKLPLNFNSPYKATSIIDFWRRWHMTLSRFLREYVYFSLGGNKKGTAHRYLNMFLTMVIGGLWHGAGWTFIFWGTLHGVYLIINHAWRNINPFHIDRWWSRFLARSLTFLAVMCAWVFFRASTFDGALNMFHALLIWPTSIQDSLGQPGVLLQTIGISFTGGILTSENVMSLIWFVVWISIIWTLPNTQQFMAKFTPADDFNVESAGNYPAALRWTPTLIWGLVAAIMLAASLLSMNKVSEFLYFQF